MNASETATTPGDGPKTSAKVCSCVAVGVLFCVAVSLAFALLSPQCAHWFLVPVTVCACVLIGDVIDWLTGEVDLFDPVGIVSLFGLHFFFLAPILHVHWDTWMSNVAAPADWRTWIGYMGLLNLLGLAIYKTMNRRGTRTTLRLQTRWTVNKRNFCYVCTVALAMALLAQAYVYRHFGGVMGYVRAFESTPRAFDGMGRIFLLSESFPVLAFMFYAVVFHRTSTRPKWGAIVTALVAFVALKIVFGGLRGSRSNTVLDLFWAAGVVHCWIRPLSRRTVLASILPLVLFMQIYGFYKTDGLDSLDVLKDTRSYFSRSGVPGHTASKVLLGDLARADVQAFLLYRLSKTETHYRPKWGQTYISWLTLMLPPSIRPTIEGKREAGTEAQYDHHSAGFLSSRIYGLSGEAMLNFGVLAIPFAFGVFGWVVSRTRSFVQALPQDDARNLIAPFLVALMVIMLANDMNNCQFFVIKHLIIPLVLLRACSRVTHATTRPATAAGA